VEPCGSSIGAELPTAAVGRRLRRTGRLTRWVTRVHRSSCLFNRRQRREVEPVGGQIVDATLVPAPRQHFTKEDKEQLEKDAMPADWSPPKRRQKDLDATWTSKHGKSHYGYKFTVNVDNKHKFIRKIVTDTASPHDSMHFEAAIDPLNTSRDVFADRGYPSKERQDWLKAHGYRDQIQRKGYRNKPLTQRQQGRNQRIAKTRTRVEHVFAAIEQMGGKLIRTIGQARANFAMTMMAACYNLNRLTSISRGRGLCRHSITNGPNCRCPRQLGGVKQGHAAQKSSNLSKGLSQMRSGGSIEGWGYWK
jgi:IS5 family transposase